MLRRHVFISYKREDAAVALQLYTALRSQGLRVWWDQKLQTGGKWANEIDRALSDAYAVCVLWSQAASSSSWVCHEASVASSRGALLQTRIQDCEPPPIHAHMLVADLRTLPTIGFDDELGRRLLPTLRKMRWAALLNDLFRAAPGALCSSRARGCSRGTRIDFLSYRGFGDRAS